MKCPNCGVETASQVKFCPNCGYSYEHRAVMPPQRYIESQPRKSEWTTGTIIIVLIVIFVIIPVVLSAILYVMVLGFGGTSETTPAALYVKEAVTGGWRISIVSISKTDVVWDQIRVQLSDGTDFAEWAPISSDLDGGAAITTSYGSRPLGALSVSLSVTDISGNGVVSGSDYFTVTATAFDPNTTYWASLIYLNTGERIGTGITFSG